MPARPAIGTKPKLDLPVREAPFKSLTPEHSTPVSLPEGLEDGELIVATNNGDAPMKIGYNSRDYILHPAKPTRVPFEAVCVWFGDPRTGPVVKRLKLDSGVIVDMADRYTEVRRLRAKYGIIDGDEHTFCDRDGVKMIPDVTLETLDGKPIPSVLDYPDGIPTMVMPGSDDIATLKAQLIRQQNTVNHLVELLGERGVDLTTPDMPTDDREDLAVDVDE